MREQVLTIYYAHTTFIPQENAHRVSQFKGDNSKRVYRRAVSLDSNHISTNRPYSKGWEVRASKEIARGSPLRGLLAKKKLSHEIGRILNYILQAIDFVGRIGGSFCATVCHIAHNQLFEFFLQPFGSCAFSFGVEERSIARE